MLWRFLNGLGYDFFDIFVKTVSGRINSDTYIAYEKHCHPFNERHSPRWFRSAARQWQHSCFKKSLDCFEEARIELLPWPSRSPDLNIIENVWSMLSLRVYDGPQPKNKQELEERVFKAVDHKKSHLSEYVNVYIHRCIVVSYRVLREMEIKFLSDFVLNISEVVRKHLAHFCVQLMKLHVLRWYEKM